MFYGDAIRNIQPRITEMIVHLAYDDEEMRGVAHAHPDWGAEWRQRDFQFVTRTLFANYFGRITSSWLPGAKSVS